jgi:hypothetical protein
VSLRDSEKIPLSKLFKFEQCFFLVTFDVEKTIDGGGNNDDDDDDDDGN